MAAIAGNFVSASPVGTFGILFAFSLDAHLILVMINNNGEHPAEVLQRIPGNPWIKRPMSSPERAFWPAADDTIRMSTLKKKMCKRFTHLDIVV